MIAIFIGAGCGALLRALICAKIQSCYATMTVNILGALLIGFLYELLRSKSNLPAGLKPLLITGLLGGFTTFSSYLMDFVLLLENHDNMKAFLYLFLSIGLGIFALLVGMKSVAFFGD